MKLKSLIAALLSVVLSSAVVEAGEVAAELKKAIGYVVVEVLSLQSTEQSNDGAHVVTLSSGATLSIRPLIFKATPNGSSVAILAKLNEKDPKKSEIILLMGDTAHPAVLLNPR